MWSHSQGTKVTPIQGALCGALAGGFSAAVTTPLDVAKTRVILAEVSNYLVIFGGRQYYVLLF